MKVILEFNGLEEIEEYQNAINGWKYKSILNDIREMIRSKEKYTEEGSISLPELRQYLFDKLDEYEVSIN